MASRSGLSRTADGSPAADPSLPPCTAAPTATWTDLMRRQCRVISSASEVGRRLAIVRRKLESLGALEALPSDTRSGPEWTALAARQQSLLQAICAVKERLKALQPRVGITSAAYEESVARPQLLRKVPSHFNNAQLLQFLTDAAVQSTQQHSASSSSSSSAAPAALYRLNKLLACVLVRDVRRLVSQGGHRALQPLSQPLGLPHSLVHSNRVLREEEVDTLLPPLLSVLLRHLVGAQASEAQVSRLASEGRELLKLSLSLDSTSRALLHEEDYSLEMDADNLSPSPAVTASQRAFEAKQARSWFVGGRSPFADFRFSRPPSSLANAPRMPCSRCGKPSSLYCALCVAPALPPELAPSPLRLPVHVDIIHHAGENVKKSTSLHACILAPDSARLLEHPHQLPQYDPARTLLLYPTSDAVFLDDPALDLKQVDRIVVIEATWAKSDVVSAHPGLQGVRRVKIRERESTFWRYQELGRHFLSTLEAIYYTCREIDERRRATASAASTDANGSSDSSGGVSTNLDDLMYFYAYQHGVITQRYAGGGAAVPKSWSGGGSGAAGVSGKQKNAEE